MVATAQISRLTGRFSIVFATKNKQGLAPTEAQAEHLLFSERREVRVSTLFRCAESRVPYSLRPRTGGAAEETASARLINE